MKDGNFKKGTLKVDQFTAHAVMAQLSLDTIFLREHKITDYAFLVAFHDPSRNGQGDSARSIFPTGQPSQQCSRWELDDGGFRSRPPGGVDEAAEANADSEPTYFFGFVDILNVRSSQ